MFDYASLSVQKLCVSGCVCVCEAEKIFDLGMLSPLIILII